VGSSRSADKAYFAPSELRARQVPQDRLRPIGHVLVELHRAVVKELDIDTRARNAVIRSVRCLGEHGFALLTQRGKTLQHVTVSPGKIGLIARAAFVLMLFEHKMIT
jgi:hypothetical protein